MADRPIIFSAPMVRALLDGRKSQTRRILKPQPVAGADLEHRYCDGVRFSDGLQARIRIEKGDKLYVREAHAFVGSCDPGWLLYRSSGYESECQRHGFDLPDPDEKSVRWRPSIHMPRSASRLTLTVTDVRVQRLQEISLADATAEGCDFALALTMKRPNGAYPGNSRECFCDLWNSLHGPDAWDANPWVVAYSFTVERRNIDQKSAGRLLDGVTHDGFPEVAS